MLRRIFTIVPIFLLIGASLLLFFINLAGANNSGVLANFYWSEVDARQFDIGRNKVRWTLYSICGVKDGDNADCSSTSPAYPYSPVDNFDSLENIPKEFIDNRDTYYYLSRFAYAFFLIGIVFAIIALIPTLLSCCVSGYVTGILSSIAVGIALLFTAAAASFNTAAHVKGRNAFRDAGYSSNIGTNLFAVTWAAVACLLLSFIWMCCVAIRGASKKLKHADDHESYVENKNSSSISSDEQQIFSTHYSQYEQTPVQQTTINSPPPRRFVFKGN